MSPWPSSPVQCDPIRSDPIRAEPIPSDPVQAIAAANADVYLVAIESDSMKPNGVHGIGMHRRHRRRRRRRPVGVASRPAANIGAEADCLLYFRALGRLNASRRMLAATSAIYLAGAVDVDGDGDAREGRPSGFHFGRPAVVRVAFVGGHPSGANWRRLEWSSRAEAGGFDQTKATATNGCSFCCSLQTLSVRASAKNMLTCGSAQNQQQAQFNLSLSLWLVQLFI